MKKTITTVALILGVILNTHLGICKPMKILANSAPTDIILSTNSINEKNLNGTILGNLSSIDVDLGNTFTYTLASGVGNDDNSSFQIMGTILVIKPVTDYETKSSYKLRLRTTDQGGLFFEKAIVISINNVNETPTDITLSNTSINDNVAANSTVGVLGTVDVDAGDTFTYTLVAGTGGANNAAFNINGNNLRISNSPVYETKSSYSIRIKTTDQGGLTYEEAFTITINESVNIPDANFKAALIGNNAINTNNDSKIQFTEASVYSGTIDVNSKTISSLQGIEAFVNITELICSDNSLTSLNVSNLTNLQILRCERNQIASIDISSNLALTEFHCLANKITSLDVSKNTSLTALSCSYNKLSSLDVSKLGQLTALWCDNNSLTSISIVNNPLLRGVFCDNNLLASIDLSKNQDLITFYGAGNNFSYLDFLNNPKLGNVSMNSNSSLDTVCILKTHTTDSWNFDVSVTNLVKCLEPTTWDGLRWTNKPFKSGISDVAIESIYDADVNGAFSARDILIKNGAILNTNGSSISGRNLTLEDGASIIHSANELSLTGNITIKRNGTNSASTYNYWSSPVQSGSLASLGGNTYQYNEAGRTATDYTSGWKAASGAMTVGKGYTATGTGVATFNGLLNSGNVSIPVTNTPIAGGTNDGWNLIGNPYPSELGIAEFFDANASLPNAVYYWNGGNYITANSGNIPLAQGFFVRALSSGTVQFTNAMREGGATALYRTESAESAIIPITSPSGSKDQTQIDINPKATLGFDALYDAAKLKGNTTLQLYSKIGADNFAINSLDASALGKTIYLGLDAVAGTYTIGKASAKLSGTDIYLNDKSSNKTINLNTESYTFSTNAVSGSDRFSLTLGSIVTGVDALEAASGSTIYIQNERLFVANMPYGASVSLFSQEGKQLLTGNTSAEGMDISTLSTGLYVVKASDAKAVVTSKIIVQ